MNNLENIIEGKFSTLLIDDAENFLIFLKKYDIYSIMEFHLAFFLFF